MWKLDGYGSNESFGLGDFVQIYDSGLEIDSKVRIVEYDYYPYEPQSSSLVLGNPAKTVFEILAETVKFQEYYNQPETPMPSITEITEAAVKSIEKTLDNSITEVVNHQVISADNAMLSNVWARYMLVEFMETNFEAIDIRMPAPPNMQRNFIRIQGQAHLGLSTKLCKLFLNGRKFSGN